MKEKLIQNNFRCPLRIQDKWERDAKRMGLTKTAYIIMLIANNNHRSKNEYK